MGFGLSSQRLMTLEVSGLPRAPPTAGSQMERWTLLIRWEAASEPHSWTWAVTHQHNCTFTEWEEKSWKLWGTRAHTQHFTARLQRTGICGKWLLIPTTKKRHSCPWWLKGPIKNLAIASKSLENILTLWPANPASGNLS